MLVKTINVDIAAASVTPVGTLQTVVLSGGEGAAPLYHSEALIIKNISILVVTAQVCVTAAAAFCRVWKWRESVKMGNLTFITKAEKIKRGLFIHFISVCTSDYVFSV